MDIFNPITMKRVPESHFSKRRAVSGAWIVSDIHEQLNTERLEHLHEFPGRVNGMTDGKDFFTHDST